MPGIVLGTAHIYELYAYEIITSSRQPSMVSILYYPNFTDEETEVQREVTCTRDGTGSQLTRHKPHYWMGNVDWNPQGCLLEKSEGISDSFA